MHDGAQVGDGVEECFDFAGGGSGWLGGPQLPDSLVDGVATAAQFFDSLFRERDDWMVRVVVFFEAERLAVEGAIDLLLLVCELRELTRELGWSHRRLIVRFREQVGLTPKALARVIRFDRAVSELRSSRARPLAEIAVGCGYFDQAHLNRDFRELAGTTPTAFVSARLESGGVAA